MSDPQVSPTEEALLDNGSNDGNKDGGMKGECCPEGSIGKVERDASAVLHGTTVHFGGIDIYVVGDTEEARNKGVAILVAHDIFGVDSGRTKQICDRLSEKLGIITLLPDLFLGKPPLSRHRSVFVNLFFCGGLCKLLCCNRGLRWNTIQRLYMDGPLQYLREKYEISKFACLGFCWGGWFASHLASHEEVCGIAVCHPSLEPCKFSGETPEDVITQMATPTMMLAAANDADLVKPEGEMQASLRARGIPESLLVFKEYAKMKHGWVNRGDLQDPEIAEAVESALVSVESFFNDCFAAMGK